jgi:hypothetical protein
LVLKWIAIALALLISIALLIVAPIDRTSLEEQPFYQRMNARMDSFQLENHPTMQPIKVGRSKVSITPDYSMPMAGYGPREHFTEVHDSLYARILSIDNGSRISYIVTVDLLIFPPLLKEAIYENLDDDWNDFIYFSATHTHSGVGGWDPSWVGEFTMGEYDASWINTTAKKMADGMRAAKSASLSAGISYFEIPADWYVFNHLSGNAAKDGNIRGLTFECKDQSKIMLVTYSAHATLLSGNYTTLSADYPGQLVRELEKEVDFAIFLSGMVGSHRIKGMKRKGFDFVSQVGKVLAHHALKAKQIKLDLLPDMLTGRIEVEHGPSQLRLTRNLKLRDWVFRNAVRPLRAEMTVLQLGNVLLIGTSCDFSGEIAVKSQLQELAASRNLHLIITSFNGEYTGYITHDEHYNNSRNETVRILNWVGPHFGEYYSEIIKRIIESASAD